MRFHLNSFLLGMIFMGGVSVYVEHFNKVSLGKDQFAKNARIIVVEDSLTLKRDTIIVVPFGEVDRRSKFNFQVRRMLEKGEIKLDSSNQAKIIKPPFANISK